MPFFTYLIIFDSGYLYTGQTRRVRNRSKEHWRKGGNPKVIWKQSFPTREEAIAREKQIKGWTRAKKLALASGAVNSLEVLAKRRGGRAPLRGRLEGSVGTSGRALLTMEEKHLEFPT
jgi:predicted GIY-YIG superfamily endonuclease